MLTPLLRVGTRTSAAGAIAGTSGLIGVSPVLVVTTVLLW